MSNLTESDKVSETNFLVFRIPDGPSPELQ
jgi:hypothetical protein